MRVRILALLLCALLASADVASAAGMPLRGTIVNRELTLYPTAGPIRPTWRWYTLGLQPGQVVIHVTVQRCEQPTGSPTCGLNGFLLQGNQVLDQHLVGCTFKPHCGATFTLQYRVRRGGVYYLLFKALGAYTVHFVARFQGAFYTPACAKRHCR